MSFSFFRPPGSEAIAAWAGSKGLPYQAAPEDAWYRAWEPFDTIAAPMRYHNAVAFTVDGGQGVLVEPWSAAEGDEPLGRTVLAFVTHPGLRLRAAARRGASYLTRVAFLGSRPPREQKLGEPAWDDEAHVFAQTQEDARAAITPSLRKLLAGWSWTGHLELRPGGLVLHVGDALPTPTDYQRVLRWMGPVVEKATKR